MGRIRQSLGADLAAAPGLLDDPGTGVIAIGGIVQVFLEVALRVVTPPAVLVDDDETAFDKKGGNLRARFGVLHGLQRAF